MLRQVANTLSETHKDNPVFMDTEGVFYTETTLVQVMMKGWETALLVERPPMGELRKFIESVRSVWQNASYDFSTVGILPTYFEDTLMLGKLHFYKEERHNLAALYTYAFGYDPYEQAGLDKKVMQKTNWAGELTNLQYTYAAIDVFYMPELWEVLEPLIDDFNYKLDIQTIRHCHKMEKNGIPLTPLKEELNEVTLELETLEKRLPVNPRSPKQVSAYLDMPDGTGADKLAVVIASGGKHAENAQMVRTARELSKYKGTYLDKMVGHARWYGHFVPRTKSGRLASSDNNLQNLPRKMKKFIGFEKWQDRVIVSVDFAQLELRTIAAITGDKTMVRLFKEGIDVHGYVAEMLFGADYTKKERQIAKTCNFALLYGASAAKYAAILLKDTGIIVSEGLAQTYKKKWLALFPGIASWQTQATKSWRAGNYWFTPMGRRYKAKLMTDFMNIRNQGAGGEVAKLAFNYISKGFDFNDSSLDNFVHDSFVADCPNDPAIYEPIAELFADSLQLAWAEYGNIVDLHDIPMPVDCGVALTWADADGMTDDCIYKLQRTA
jgi:DNA polymerase-1